MSSHDVKIEVVRVPTLLGAMAIVAHAYLKRQLTRAEFYERITILGQTWALARRTPV